MSALCCLKDLRMLVRYCPMRHQRTDKGCIKYISSHLRSSGNLLDLMIYNVVRPFVCQTEYVRAELESDTQVYVCSNVDLYIIHKHRWMCWCVKLSGEK